MWIEFTIILFILFIYFSCYVDIKINKYDTITLFDKELTRSKINHETYLKLPFYFDGKHINEPYSKSELTKLIKEKGKYEKYKKQYDTSIHLLEPYTKFHPSQDIYYISKKGSLPLLQDNCSVNYYIIKKGICKISFIHPKYIEHFRTNKKDELSNLESKIQFIKDNKNIKCIIFHENTIVYVPNDWIIYIENHDKQTTILEVIHYSSLCNQFIGWCKKVFNKKIE